MTRTERFIAVLCGLLTIVGMVWNIISWFQSKPIPLWFYLVSVIASGVLGFCVGRFHRLSRRSPSLKPIGVLAFDYLPDSPTRHGWHLDVDVQDGAPPSFSAATDAPLPGALAVAHTSKYHMDYPLDQTFGLSNMAEFFIRFANASAFYFKVS